MPAAPPVTVLMTVYNGMAYLREALESVLKQTFVDFELLVIDDASTDGSPACVESFRDARIRLVRNSRNIGQAASLNKGISLASSPFIARLDQDDLCLPDRLAAQISFLKEHAECAAVGSWLYWIDSKGRKTGVAGLRIHDFGSLLGILLGRATPLAHSTALFRRDIVEGMGGYDETFAPCEDYDLWCRLARRRCGIGMVHRPLVMLRFHDRQQSAVKLLLQQEQADRAHSRFLASLDSGKQTLGVSRLLRMDEGFWQDHRSWKEVKVVCEALEELLADICGRFRLSPSEESHLKQRVSEWLSRSAFLAILHRRYRSLLVYRAARRYGPRVRVSPLIPAYPVFLLLSPLFGPGVRGPLARVIRWLSRQRYLVRLAFDGGRA